MSMLQSAVQPSLMRLGTASGLSRHKLPTVVQFAGMASSPIVQAQLKRSGMAALEPSRGLHALSAVLAATAGGRHSAQLSAVPLDWGIVLKQASQAAYRKISIELTSDCLL